MESMDTVEPDEMSGRVLGIIGAYGLGAALDHRRTPANAPADPQDGGLVDDAGEPKTEVTEEQQGAQERLSTAAAGDRFERNTLSAEPVSVTIDVRKLRILPVALSAPARVPEDP